MQETLYISPFDTTLQIVHELYDAANIYAYNAVHTYDFRPISY